MAVKTFPTFFIGMWIEQFRHGWPTVDNGLNILCVL